MMRRWCGATVSVLLVVPITAQAQMGVGGTAPARAPVTAIVESDLDMEASTSLSLEAGVDWTNSYFYHGIYQEDDGTILQPWIEIGLTLDETDSYTLTAYLDVWTSLHGKATGARTTSDTTEHFYEADLWPGIGIEAGRWSFRANYHFDTSPSDAFKYIEELEFAIELDDDGLWAGNVALNPHLIYTIETGGEGFNDGGDRGSYLEFGVSPGASMTLAPEWTVDVSVPVSVGLSVYDYFEDGNGQSDTFGFFQFGVAASCDLPGGGASGGASGAWSMHAGLHWMFLGDATTSLANGDDTHFIAIAGISVSF